VMVLFSGLGGCSSIYFWGPAAHAGLGDTSQTRLCLSRIFSQRPAARPQRRAQAAAVGDASPAQRRPARPRSTASGASSLHAGRRGYFCTGKKATAAAGVSGKRQMVLGRRGVARG
jgi:hypothetical protein